MTSIQSVPTNIITGALGAGKTTLIKTLLEQKPATERWAVLVNEFGEVGIDGALLSGSDKRGVFIREVPGGCMCCTSGLPMQIALNQLLAAAKPDRLLIEPTGLGHPTEVLQTLCEPHYQDVLNVQATITLIDARKLNSKRWVAHPTFREQLQIADRIVATKTEFYTESDWQNLEDYLVVLNVSDTPRSDTGSQQLDFSMLSHPSHFAVESKAHHHHHSTPQEVVSPASLLSDTREVIKVANQGQGFFSYGWVCAPKRVFDFEQIQSVCKDLSVERLKAVMITDKGVYGFNLSEGQLQVTKYDDADDSRLEFIVDSQHQAELTAETLEVELGLVG